MITAPANVGDRGVLRCSKFHKNPVNFNEAVCQSLSWVTNSSDLMYSQDWNRDFCIGTIAFNALSHQSIQCGIEFELNNTTFSCLSEAVTFQPQGI